MKNNIHSEYELTRYLNDTSIYSEAEYEIVNHIKIVRYYVGEGMIIIKDNPDEKQGCYCAEDARIIMLSRSVPRNVFIKLLEYLDKNQKTLGDTDCRYTK